MVWPAHPAMPSSPRSAPRSRVALVVDGNVTSRRFVELALGRTGDFGVEAAQDAASAREVLKAQLVDLIICDTELDDTTGLAFFKSLQEQHRLRSVPFVFLTAERSVEAKVAAFKAGVDDYLVKPCDVAELVARADALVTRHRTARDLACARTFNLAGDLSVVPLADLVGIIEMGRRTGVLSIVTEKAVGQLHFDVGRVVHAVCGNLVGPEAFYWLFRQPNGHFEFLPGPRPVAFTLEGSATELLLEAARRLDTTTRASGVEEVRVPHGLTTRPPPPEHELFLDAVWHLEIPTSGKTIATVLEERPLQPALVPTPVMATQFERSLGDPYTLGELNIWTEASLMEWTQRNVGVDRLHVHLVCDLVAGVSALLSLSAAPTERWVVDCLSPGRKTLGLTFQLRSDRIVDVVLVDAAEPMSHTTSLMRAPALLLFCPPRGSLLSLGTGARFELEMLIESVRPRAVLGVGNPTLSQIEAFRKKSSDFRFIAGDFGEGQDLRSLLVEGVRHWASTEGLPDRSPSSTNGD